MPLLSGSQMPRHLVQVGGAHEWKNEIPTATVYYLAVTAAEGTVTGLESSAGKEDPVKLESGPCEMT